MSVRLRFGIGPLRVSIPLTSRRRRRPARRPIRVQARRTTTQRVTPPPPAGPSGASARYFARTAQRQQAAAARATLQGRTPPQPGAPGQLVPPTFTPRQRNWALGCLGAALGLFFLSALIGAIVSPNKTSSSAKSLPLAASSSAAAAAPASTPTPSPVTTSSSPSPSPTPKPSPTSFKVGNYVGANLASVESQLKAHGILWTAIDGSDNSTSPDSYGADSYIVCKQSTKAGTVLTLSSSHTVKLTAIEGYLGCDSLNTPADGGSTGSTTGGNGAPAGATAICVDGTYSYSQHHSGTCSHHGGVAQWLN